MKKLLIPTLLVLLMAGCAKEARITNSNNNDGFEVKATLADTKVSYASDGAAKEGFTAAFSEGDRIFMWFKGNSTKHDKLTIQDGYTNTSATFRIASPAIDPSGLAGDGLNFGAFLTSNKTYDNQSAPRKAAYRFSESNTASFKNGLWFGYTDGTPEAATAANVLFASGTYSDGLPALSFNYLSSIIKMVITLPAGAGATKDNTEIYITGEKIYDYLYPDVITGECRADSGYTPTENGIQITPAASCFSGDVITTYASLWTSADGITIKNAKVDVVVNGTDHYGFDIADGTGVTLQPAKVYTLSKTASLSGLAKWVNDDAGNISVPAGDGSQSAGTGSWLTYNNGTLSWTANATGSPRQAELTVNGITIDITQIDETDFAGSWTMYAYKVFAGSIGAGNAYASTPQNTPTNSDYSIMEANLASYISKSVTLAKLDGESEISSTTNSGIYQSTNKHTNNITIEGLSDPDLLVKAQLKIDLDGQNASLGLQTMQPFVTSAQIATPQLFSTSGFSAYYAWLMPELCKVYTNGTVSSWHLNFGTLGDDSKYWLDANISVTGDITKIYWNLEDGHRPTLTTSTSYKVAGLMVNPFNASGTGIGASGGPSASTLIRNVSNVAKTGNSQNAAWQYVYQGSICLTK